MRPALELLIAEEQVSSKCSTALHNSNVQGLVNASSEVCQELGFSANLKTLSLYLRVSGFQDALS